MKWEEPDGATPLEPEEKQDLIPDIQTREELNEWEQNNILEAERWLFPTRRSLDRILTTKFLSNVHETMFEHVWEWAGEFRQTGKNIGIEARQIPVECKKLFENAMYRKQHDTYEDLEFCARIHHRLTEIHPFPNGNGRHARLYVDYVSHCMGNSRFSWGSQGLVHRSEVRDQYLHALRKADNGTIQPLMDFMQA